MKLSYSWLQDYFADPLPKPSDVAEALTFHAFEIESLDNPEGEAIIDLKITPNRGHDALCHRGVAKEIAAVYGRPLLADPLSLEAKPDISKESEILTVDIEDPHACPRYSAAVMRGVKVGPSPEWLKSRLESIGQRSINNVVDATNYVMFNLGQPLHAFDMAHLEAKDGKYSIFVRHAAEGEEMETLDGVARELAESMLVIGDGNSSKALGVAGVKGGMSSGISEKTTDIIIESANFDGVSTRKTAKALGLRTDASSRFEHEISAELTPYALAACVKLIGELAGGEVEGFRDVYCTPEKQRTVSVSVERANALLGLSLSAADLEDIFKRLGFTYTRVDDSFAVIAPFERLDLRIPEDLVEEIGRIHGLEDIKPELPEATAPAAINKRFYYMDRVRQALVENGFSEVYTSSFVPAGKGDVEVMNPAAQDKPMLRRDLSTNLAPALAMNSRNAPLLGVSATKIFEIGTIFFDETEEVHLALGVEAGKKQTEAAFEEAEKVLAEALGVAVSAETKDGIREYNFSQLLEKLPAPSVYEERAPTLKLQYKPFSLYPFVLRDIALWVPAHTEIKNIENILREHAGPMLVRLDLFDTFTKGEQTSYAFHLVFQSKEKTLTDAEINEVMQGVTSALTEQGYTIR